jgi:hypothetical protein
MVDLKFDDDIVIEIGDFKQVDSINQEVEAIMRTPHGCFRNDGYLGIDLLSELMDDNIINIKRQLIMMLKRDMKRLNTFNITTNGKIQIDVERL